jgi:transposase InsO family protein
MELACFESIGYFEIMMILNFMKFVNEFFGYLIRFVVLFFYPKAVLAARLLAIQSQMALCKNRIDLKKDPKLRFTPAFRILWVVLSKLLDGWEELAQLMQPATGKKWHTTAFKFYWRWKSRKRTGRPTVSKEMQDLIRQVSSENPLWGAEHIRETLLLLQYDPPCEDTVRKYMIKHHNPKNKSITWLPFMRNHLDVSWAIDFFTVTTLRFATLYVFVILDHGRRKVLRFAITPNPSMNWVIQQLREAMPFGTQPKYLFRDNDCIYGLGVKAFLNSNGIEEVKTAYRSPWQNPIVERFGGTLRREILDHVIVLNQKHLERLLAEFIEEYYHRARPHQGLNGDTPIPQKKLSEITEPSNLISIPVLGGLHHRYQRVAA